MIIKKPIIKTEYDQASFAIVLALENNIVHVKVDEKFNFLVFMLIWSKFIPQTKGNIIGFFDVLETVDSEEKLELIINALNKETTIDVENLLGRKDQQRKLITFIDSQRTDLFPTGRYIVKSGEKGIAELIDFVHLWRFEKGWDSTIGPGLLDPACLAVIKNELINNLGNSFNLNCLFPATISLAPIFANYGNVFINEKTFSEKLYAKGLISLYGKPLRFNSQFFKKDPTLVIPPIGIKDPKLLETNPLEEDKDSKLIGDLHTKLIYLAHKNTENLTIALTSTNTLFSKTTGINYFRKKIIENNWLEKIVQLPKCFKNTNISMALLVLKKDRKKQDLITSSDLTKKGNLEEENSELVEKEDYFKDVESYVDKININKIKSNDYDWNFKKYLISSEDKKLLEILQNRDVLSLSSIVDFIRPLSLRRDPIGPELNEVMVSDINNIGIVNSAEKTTLVSEEFLAKSNLPLTKKGDLVISIKGTVGKVGIISEDLPNTIPGPSLCILRPYESSKIKAEFLLQYLRSYMGQQMIKRSSQGGVIPFISIADLKNLNIPIPTIEEQNDAQKKSARLKELNESIEKMQEELQQSTFDGWLKDTAKRHNYIIEKVIDKKSLKQKRGEK